MHAAAKVELGVNSLTSLLVVIRNLDTASQKLLLFSSQEYSMISQSVRSVKVRVLLQGFVKRLRIVDQDLIGDVTQVGTGKALDGVQLFAVRNGPMVSNSRPPVEVGRVDDQGVAFPFADGIAEPGFPRPCGVDGRRWGPP